MGILRFRGAFILLFTLILLIGKTVNAEYQCLGKPTSQESDITLYEVCESQKKGCKELPSLQFSSKWVHSTPLSWLRIKDATIYPNPKNRKLINISIVFDEGSACLLHKVTQKNIGKTIALVHQGKILIAPKVIAPIPNGKAAITLGSNSTLLEAIQLCEEITPTCKGKYIRSDLEEDFKAFREMKEGK